MAYSLERAAPVWTACGGIALDERRALRGYCRQQTEAELEESLPDIVPGVNRKEDEGCIPDFGVTKNGMLRWTDGTAKFSGIPAQHDSGSPRIWDVLEDRFGCECPGPCRRP